MKFDELRQFLFDNNNEKPTKNLKMKLRRKL